MLAKFFGKLSPFEVLISSVALATGVYTFYKSFIEGPRLSVCRSNSIQVFPRVSDEPSRFQISGVITNSGVKLGIMRNFSATVTDPQGAKHFYLLGRTVEYTNYEPFSVGYSPARPIGVPPRDTRPFNIEFFHDENGGDHLWEEGGYRFEVIASSETVLNRRRNDKIVFDITIDDMVCLALSSDKCSILSLPITS